MKTELKRELFYSAKALCNFVNEHQITRERKRHGMKLLTGNLILLIIITAMVNWLTSLIILRQRLDAMGL